MDSDREDSGKAVFEQDHGWLLLLLPLAFTLLSCSQRTPILAATDEGAASLGGRAGERTESHPLDFDSRSRDLAPFVPTPMPVVLRMLEMAKVTKNDVIYDLGCGDGRIVVEAARRYGARGVGIDYDLRRVKEAQERAAREGVSDLVDIRHEDILKSDFSDATVIVLYLLPASNERLEPKLRALRPGTRIVAHDFGIGSWKPVQKEVLWLHDVDRHSIYLWKVGE